ncbi:skin secretory protein xP2-like isoform X5 [Frankliniella occidentalis]|uniref:Skin secretory protein xP2-like isoform X5 n=1 Tax=Frankliniella occidentalis TaxID=133901 RepID=A0A9C6XWV3_FRAOC|nr:skin secretory protein xP2-like isoform X5 [Frankliniella occidentalis]
MPHPGLRRAIAFGRGLVQPRTHSMVGAAGGASLCCALLLVTATWAARVKAPCLEGREGRTRSEIILNDWACANKCGGGRGPQRGSNAARDRGGARHCDLCCASSNAATGRGAACGKSRGDATTAGPKGGRGDNAGGGQGGRGDNTVHIVIEVVAGKNVAARPGQPGGKAGQAQGDATPSAAKPGTEAASGGQGSVSAPGQEQGSTPAPGQEQGSTPVPGQEQSSTPAPGQEQGSTPAPGQEQGSTPAPGQEQVSTPAPGQEQGSTPVPGQEQSSTPAPGQEQGSTPAPGQEQGSTPAPGQEQSSTAPGQEQGSTPAPGQEQGSDYYFELEVKEEGMGEGSSTPLFSL